MVMLGTLLTRPRSKTHTLMVNARYGNIPGYILEKRDFNF